jgi:hypothetical protein
MDIELSTSDLRALSFVQAIRDLIEERTGSNLRALMEDDPKAWHTALSGVLIEVGFSIRRTPSTILSDTSIESPKGSSLDKESN